MDLNPVSARSEKPRLCYEPSPVTGNKFKAKFFGTEVKTTNSSSQHQTFSKKRNPKPSKLEVNSKNKPKTVNIRPKKTKRSLY
jgi:hypothetical protein